MSRELLAEFPNMKGFSYRNLKYIRQWYQFYNERIIIGQQAVAQFGDKNLQQPVVQINEETFFSVPWGHPKLMPENIQRHLPTIEDIEATLSDSFDDGDENKSNEPIWV